MLHGMSAQRTSHPAPDESPVAAPLPDAPELGDEDTVPADVVAHPLARRQREKREQHRGLLLYAMQDPERRSLRLVSRALGRDESTVRYWYTSRGWTTRITEAGPGVQSLALSRYRAECLMHASALELEAVRGNVSIPLIAEDPAAKIIAPESVQEGRHETRLDPEGHDTTAPAVRGQPKQKRVNPELEVIEKGILIYDAIIARFAGQVATSKEVKILPKDVPFIVASRRKLARDRAMILGEGLEEHGGVDVPESYRVRAVRAAGGNVLAAAAEDARDLFVALTAMSQQGQADAELDALLAARARLAEQEAPAATPEPVQAAPSAARGA